MREPSEEGVDEAACAGGDDLGSLLKRRRRAAGLTQAELAARARVSVHAVSNLERGAARLPHTDTLRLLADALELAPAEQDALRAARRQATRMCVAEDAGRAPSRFEVGALPMPLTPLIGREDALREVCDALTWSDTRLLTLVGAPGVGKTRLAQAAAAELAREFADGVAFVPLATLDDATQVLPTLARRFGVPDDARRDLLAALVAALGGRRLLLVLDNFEQIVSAVPLVAELLAALPGLRALVTSRAPLRVRGEHEYRVAPLALPDPALAPSADELAAIPAVALFAACARRILPTFAVTRENAAAVAAICRRLDGLPLALELAAARLKLLAPDALLERLERGEGRLPLLADGPRDLPPHQRMLRDAIAWSYDLLEAREQAVFLVLSVFAGGAALESAESVCREALPEVGEPLTALAALVDASLAVREEGAEGGSRLRLLETIREYAVERLASDGDEQERACRAHARHYAARIEAFEAEERRIGGGRTGWVARCEEELPNLRAALRWALGREVETGLRIAGALGTYWYLSGRLCEGLEWLYGLLALAGEGGARALAPLRAKALLMAGWLAADQGRSHDAAALLEECVTLRREVGDDAAVAEALHRLGAVALARGEHTRARELLEEALALQRREGDVAAAIGSLSLLAMVASERGGKADDDELRAEALLREALVLTAGGEREDCAAYLLLRLCRLAHQRGDSAAARALYAESLGRMRTMEAGATPAYTAGMLLNLGYVAGDLGEAREALALCRESLERFRAARQEEGVAFACLILGQLERARGELRAARVCLGEALTSYERLAMLHAVAACLEQIAALAAAQDAPEQAATLYGAAAALRAVIGTQMLRGEREAHERTLAALRTRLGDAAFGQAFGMGEGLPRERALALARAVAGGTPSASPISEASIRA